ncbi:MAG: hypothetical protein IPP05_11665 [Cytophagaceae bacterium]|nr:hypothetical protein [Cytophagaceae bacterium]
MKREIDGILTKISYGYLSLPFLIFCMSWLNNWSAALFSIIILVSFYFILKTVKNDRESSMAVLRHPKQLIWILIAIVFIIFFSGIGSYTFQNDDHLYRNAIFRDLVKYEWPVIYHVKGFPGHFLDGKTTMMTYYLGYYLPSAALGKVFGYDFARFALFAWTVLGTILALYQVGKFLKRFNYKVLLLFFGWGTLFFIGSLYKYDFLKLFTDPEDNYLWAGMILYADSNLGMIYWTFNQSLTAWTIMLLIYNNGSSKNAVFLYALCFYLSPFAFAGFLPFILYYFWKNFEGKFSEIKDWKTNLLRYLSFQNTLGAALIFGLNYVYLSSNQAGKFFQMLSHSPRILIIFYLLSWAGIAIVIFSKYKKDPFYWLILAVLIPLPFFQQGYGIDFPGRLSIPALFFLMLLVGKFLIEERNLWKRIPVLIYLVISAGGHLFFETGKSILYTSAENISHKTTLDDRMMDSENTGIRKLGTHLKSLEGKNICIQDLGTVVNPKNPVIWNYMADIEGSRFYRWFAEK